MEVESSQRQSSSKNNENENVIIIPDGIDNQSEDILSDITLPKSKRWYKSKNEVKLIIMMLLTIAMMVVELVVGFKAGSLALIGDAFHMASDGISLVIALIAIQMSKKKSPSANNTYGWQRAEVIGSFVNGVFLLSVCLFIALEAIQRFVTIEVVDNPMLVVYVGSAGIGVNIIGLIIFSSEGGHGHSHGGGGHGHGGGHSHDQKHKDDNHSHGHKHSDEKHSHGHKHKEDKHSHKHKHSDEKHSHDQKHKEDKHSHKHKHSDENHSHEDHSHDHKQSDDEQSHSHKHKDDNHSHGHKHSDEKHSHSDKQSVDKHENSQSPEEDHSQDEEHSESHKEHIEESHKEYENYYKDHTEDSQVSHDEEASRIPKWDGVSKTLKEESEEEESGPTLKVRDDNIRAVFLHVLGDFLGSLAAIASGLLINFLTFHERYYFDPALSLFIVLIILKTSIPLVRRTLQVLMLKVPTFINVEKLRSELVKVPGVITIHELHVWTLVGNKFIGTVHVTCLNNTDFMIIATRLKQIFHRFNVHSTTIQPEFLHTSELQRKREGCKLGCLKKDSCKSESCCPPTYDEAMGDDELQNLLQVTQKRKLFKRRKTDFH